jgi:hypothetical protein
MVEKDSAFPFFETSAGARSRVSVVAVAITACGPHGLGEPVRRAASLLDVCQNSCRRLLQQCK